MLIVAGHHRSGTSHVAQMLGRAGVFLGDDLLGAGESNPHGHFEDREILAVHDQLLADNQTDWQVVTGLLPVVNDDVWERMARFVERRDAVHDLWGFKDPRVCHLLALWKHLVPEAKIIMTFRSPAECVESIVRRATRLFHRSNGADRQSWSLLAEPDRALKLWVSSNRALLRAADAYPVDTVMIDFHQLRAGLDLIELLNCRWTLDLVSESDENRSFDPEVVTAESEDLVVIDGRLRQTTEQLWSELKQRSTRLAITETL